ncbi:MAG TPA: hypothetical protein VG407_17495 [Caulobacteraceae bacterium]|jgi:DnaJ-class molecular chaperone|nr:hypothetical protein [Caulobacteraceae bacterium]
MKENDIDDRGLNGGEAVVDPTETGQGVCPECSGTGVTAEGEVCPTCEGTGRTLEIQPGA